MICSTNNRVNSRSRWITGNIWPLVSYTVFVLLLLTALVSAKMTDCLECHQKTPPVGMEKAAFEQTALTASVHGDLLCTDCHDIDPAEKHDGNTAVDCGECHSTAKAGFDTSPHRIRTDVAPDFLPTCVTCHGGHDISSTDDPKSSTSHLNSFRICTSCHEDSKLTAKIDNMAKPSMIIDYENSVHGQELISGNENAPTCIDCHLSHSTKASDDPSSPVYKTHVAETCGTCHTEIFTEYTQSIHGTTLANGVSESPTCTDCHGEHKILKTTDPESSVYSINILKTCSGCHTSEVIVGKFGLKPDRIETFEESFHGVALELEETRAANCASCHGVHSILPQDNPNSMIHPDNIETTCGQCHEDLPPDFAHATFHKSASDPESGGAFFVREFYYWFISIILLLFIGYRILEYKRRAGRVE